MPILVASGDELLPQMGGMVLYQKKCVDDDAYTCTWKKKKGGPSQSFGAHPVTGFANPSGATSASPLVTLPI